MKELNIGRIYLMLYSPALGDTISRALGDRLNILIKND